MDAERGAHGVVDVVLRLGTARAAGCCTPSSRCSLVHCTRPDSSQTQSAGNTCARDEDERGL